MITEILTPDEFSQSGLNLLNLAWSIGMEIAHEFEGAELAEWGDDLTDEYWRESQPALGNAIALVEQAQEMALKGQIAAVSPYLLIGYEPREWPRRCEREDTPFSMFRTVDAADLIKIHNTVCHSSSRLGKDFAALFEEIRRQRNAIIHLGSAGKRMEVAELILNVLLTNEHLYPGTNWAARRLQYSQNDRLSVAYSTDHVGTLLLEEFDTAVRLLKSAQVKRFFGLTKARRYLCPYCCYEAEHIDRLIRLAQLAPNSPSATAVSCFVCGNITTVERKVCTEKGCKSNVICAEPDWGLICLVCGIEQD